MKPPPLRDRLEDVRRARAAAGPEDPARFNHVRRYCIFVGQPRSGHSMIGTLVNGHRQALVSHNLDALEYLRGGVEREDLFLLILERDRQIAHGGRRVGGYCYDFPGLGLGDYDDIRVIGDKKAGATSRHLRQDPRLLRELPARIGLPVTVVHHVRNPWDNICSMWSRRTPRDHTLNEAADQYFDMVEGAVRGLAAAGQEIRFLRTYHEELIRRPESVLSAVFDALDLAADDTFLRACAEFVHREPRQTRRSASWPAGLVADIAERAKRFDFLDRYAFDE